MITVLLNWIRAEQWFYGEHKDYNVENRDAILEMYKALDEILTSYVAMRPTPTRTGNECIMEVWKLKNRLTAQHTGNIYMLRVVYGACQLCEYAFSTPDQY